tara:strand:+ start:717 stop:1946 length:1230 start_codon:yes stop_codon:yes gene_type:complete
MLILEIAILLCISVIFLIKIDKNQYLFIILFLALLIRIVFIIIDLYLFNIPFNSLDSNTYELKANQWSRYGYKYAIENFFIEGKSFFYSNFLSIIYSFFGRSIFLSKLLSTIVSLISIFITFKILQLVWGKGKYMYYSLIILSFAPIFVLISTFTLREIYSVFFMLSAIYSYFLYEKNNKIVFFYLSLILSLSHIFIHGPMTLIFFSFVTIFYISNIYKLSKKIYISLDGFIFTNLLFLVGIFLLNFLNIIPSIPYLGSIYNAFNTLEIVQDIFINTAYGRTAYSKLLYPESYLSLVLLSPVRIINFFCGPFYINNLYEIFSIFDSILYFFLILILLINFKKIFFNNKVFSIFIISFPIILIYAWGVNNYGTALRHKTKFLPIIIIFCGPFLMFYIENSFNLIKKLIKF